ncbi:unnamed protein product [Rangifer tarandus platyrhynchus]|uniref:Uncharacterized protein n=2 Tax=Rangifer tarandus platyrhynchus TaxID=3082113 RepID=A0ABN8Y5G6_RANTA|nr:unnamed protein product [Rangifer tarandus platyrhynchus]CAI9695580.1 unnamed protein product [Rangifer tarandus platyrhynchus]
MRGRGGAVPMTQASIRRALPLPGWPASQRAGEDGGICGLYPFSKIAYLLTCRLPHPGAVPRDWLKAGLLDYGPQSGHRGQWCPRCSHRGEAAEKGVKPDLSFQLPRVLLREFTVLPAAEGPGPRDRRPLGGFSGDGAL